MKLPQQRYKAHATLQPSLIKQHVQENLRKIPLAYTTCHPLSFRALWWQRHTHLLWAVSHLGGIGFCAFVHILLYVPSTLIGSDANSTPTPWRHVSLPEFNTFHCCFTCDTLGQAPPLIGSYSELTVLKVWPDQLGPKKKIALKEKISLCSAAVRESRLSKIFFFPLIINDRLHWKPFCSPTPTLKSTR